MGNTVGFARANRAPIAEVSVIVGHGQAQRRATERTNTEPRISGRHPRVPRVALERGGCDRSRDLGRLVASRARDRAARPHRRQPMAQPALAAPDRLRAAGGGGRGREGAPDHPCRRALHPAPSGNRLRHAIYDGVAEVGGPPALLQSVLAHIHHPRWLTDPRRSSSTLLDTALHARQGVVPGAEAGTRRSAVDCEAGLDHVAETRRATRSSPLDRAGAVVAPRRRRTLARERPRILHPAVHERRMAPPGYRRAGKSSRTPAP